MNVQERLKKITEVYNLSSRQFEIMCSLGNGYINNAPKTLNEDKALKILEKFSKLNKVWLLTGEGEMFNSKTDIPLGINDIIKIPFVSIQAIGGFGSLNFAITEQDVKEYYVVPKFKHCKIDFMIEVSGSSMYPKYNSGDVVACTIIKESSFIQWNKVHLIATKEQGILIKRIKKGTSDNKILAVSDNKDYEPFEIPLKEITGIALVAGVIRLE